MRISKELILRCSSRNLVPGGDEDPRQRITHLYLQEQFIRKIENLDACRNLTALYLYDNQIDKVENLEALGSLTCLHLQNNRIRTLQNLRLPTQLAVLNLSYNAIQILEGLETLGELRELYVQFQEIPGDQPLRIDPDSVAALSENLRVLNISGNGLQSLRPFKSLLHLETLLAEENQIEDLNELVESVSDWQFVNVLKLNGNPVCKVRKYRDNIVVSCLELEELDGRAITQSYRNFLLNWKQCQSLQSRKKESYEKLKPFLEEQIHKKQLSPPAGSRPGSSTQSESSSTSAVHPRSKSCQRKDRSSSRTRSLQEMPMKLVKKLTRSRK